LHAQLGSYPAGQMMAFIASIVHDAIFFPSQSAGISTISSSSIPTPRPKSLTLKHPTSAFTLEFLISIILVRDGINQNASSCSSGSSPSARNNSHFDRRRLNNALPPRLAQPQHHNDNNTDVDHLLRHDNYNYLPWAFSLFNPLIITIPHLSKLHAHNNHNINFNTCDINDYNVCKWLSRKQPVSEFRAEC
jgi:hypothetical protein